MDDRDIEFRAGGAARGARSCAAQAWEQRRDGFLRRRVAAWIEFGLVFDPEVADRDESQLHVMRLKDVWWRGTR